MPGETGSLPLGALAVYEPIVTSRTMNPEARGAPGRGPWAGGSVSEGGTSRAQARLTFPRLLCACSTKPQPCAATCLFMRALRHCRLGGAAQSAGVRGFQSWWVIRGQPRKMVRPVSSRPRDARFAGEPRSVGAGVCVMRPILGANMVPSRASV